MLHGATIRTQSPRGRIRGIKFAPNINWDEFVIVTAKDIPGRNAVLLIDDEQPEARRGASLRRGRHRKQGGGQEQERGECCVNTHIYLYGRTTRIAFKSMQTSC